MNIKTKLYIIITILVIIIIMSVPLYIIYSNETLPILKETNYSQYLINSSASTVYLILLQTICLTTIIGLVLYLKKKPKQ